MSMTLPKAYASLSALLEKHTGQTLLANRHWRIDMALKPLMRENSIPDLDTLIGLIEIDADPKLTSACVEAMINNETCFFRDQANFALLTGPVLDMLREQRMASKKLRIWSAACSTGQEPYSLAMAIQENAEKWRGWTIQIIATDISTSALAQAGAGGLGAIGGAGEPLLECYFVRRAGLHHGRFRPPALRESPRYGPTALRPYRHPRMAIGTKSRSS